MIILNKDAAVLVQGITGREGSFHTRLMLESGTNVVAGVTPGKSGSYVEKVPVYSTIKEAINRQGPIDGSAVFVPPAQCFNAILEALDAGLKWVVVITEGIPLRDTLWLVNYAKYKGSHIIGPNCPGLISPAVGKIGIIPTSAFAPGDVGIISRSGTLTYEMGSALKSKGLGVSTAVGIGGDLIVGTSLLEIAKMLEADSGTSSMVVLGEIGGNMEDKLAQAIRSGIIKKPVIACMAGSSAPVGKRMGHAGAILQPGMTTAQEKLELMAAAGAHTAQTPWSVADIVKKIT